MNRLNRKQFINILMVLLLLVAPFQSLLAKTIMNHDDQASHSTVSSMSNAMMTFDNGSHSHGSLSHTDNSHATDSQAANQDCENQCQHCVFCGVATLSADFTSHGLISIYNPHISIHSSGITPDVAIRPPRFILSV